MLSKADTLCLLRNKILTLQGFKPATVTPQSDFGLGPIVSSFANHEFPFSALHEFICQSPQEIAASSAFITSLLSTQLKKGGIVLWIGTQRLIFPPALKRFAVDPDQMVFINARSQKEAVWAVEEALKSPSLTSVVGQIKDLDFTESRRMQLAIEQSGVGCFLLRYRPHNLTTATTTRWHIKPISSSREDNLPGLSHPRWQVDLLKVRNGKPGNWIIQWSQGRFHYSSKLSFISGERQKKTG